MRGCEAADRRRSWSKTEEQPAGYYCSDDERDSARDGNGDSPPTQFARALGQSISVIFPTRYVEGRCLVLVLVALRVVGHRYLNLGTEAVGLRHGGQVSEKARNCRTDESGDEYTPRDDDPKACCGLRLNFEKRDQCRQCDQPAAVQSEG